MSRETFDLNLEALKASQRRRRRWIRRSEPLQMFFVLIVLALVPSTIRRASSVAAMNSPPTSSFEHHHRSTSMTTTTTTEPAFSRFLPIPLRLMNQWFSRLFLKQRRFLLDAAARQRPLEPAVRPLPQNEDPEHEECNNDSVLGVVIPKQRYHDTSSALSSTISALVQNVLSDRRRIARISSSSIQVGLILFIAHAAWKALVEVVDECSAELAAERSGMEPLLFKPDQVTRALSVCEEVMSRPQSSEDAAVASAITLGTSASATVPPPLLNVIRRLLKSGLPLRSTSECPTSVESVLMRLTKSEAALLHQCLWTPPPATSAHNEEKVKIQTMWCDIVGLFPVKERLLNAIASLRGHSAQQAFRGLFDDTDSSSISSSTNNGILLYGPPGCGKTLLVKALATTARLPCLVVTPSSLLRKYVGETNSQVRNLFSLAQKLAPCILCIDELDGLFRERSESEHDVSRDLKTEFLQWMEGMLSDPTTSTSTVPKKQSILVIGATNRPFDVDAAILRRLPVSQYVGLPDAATRAVYLRKLLAKIPSEVDVNRIAMMTEGYSPSDIRQLLQTSAVMGPIRELSLQHRMVDPNGGGESSDRNRTENSEENTPRPIETKDVIVALSHSPPTPMSQNYRRALNTFARRNLPHFTIDESASGNSIWGDETFTMMRGSKWESNGGTFYHLGQLDVDPQTFDVLSDMMSQMSSLSDESSDNEEEEDTDLD